MKLGTQLHMSRQPGEFKPVMNRDFVKPIGGFWTSTYTPDKDYESDWISWCVSESPEWICPKGLIYTVAGFAKVAIIDSLEDLKWFMNLYSYWDTYQRNQYLDFERMSREFDALHITELGQWATRLSNPGLYGWDCESTLWFSMSMLSPVGTIVIDHQLAT